MDTIRGHDMCAQARPALDGRANTVVQDVGAVFHSGPRNDAGPPAGSLPGARILVFFTARRSFSSNPGLRRGVSPVR
ncbi:hypothetical protein DB35_16725 [Streptomyces abyssalis]|uniref:Uncharacterized protein n=1 Tax=Streptomyces abyssalis TaxID=933944 RepID=A0A1E7JKA9_9ACTN|nr:hypothetical protein AN215_17905 [Streptomyces abyssalis]OEU90946.1 hypothetical protein DB35_16725 [Streptomyces abyssalis]